MKYFPVLFLSLLILLSACAVNTLGSKTVKVTDYGPTVDGRSHIIAFSTYDSSVEYFYYTLDGEDPGKSSTLYIPQMTEGIDLLYHEGIAVEEGKTIKVYGAGEKEGKALTFMATTKVEETSSSLHESAPVIRKLGTLSSNSKKCIVNIESSSSSPIYYTTTAGTSPVRSGIKYTESEYKNAEGKTCCGIVVDYDETIKAVTKSDSGYSYVSSRYLYPLSTPTIKDVGEYNDVYRVYSMTADAGATIFYTTNGSDPRKYGTKYIINSYGELQGLAFQKGSTLCVVAEKNGKYSSVLSFTVSELLSFAPKCEKMGTQDEKTIISLSSNDASLPIYYTLDGTDPREEGRKYVPSSFSDGVTGISVDAGTKIRAVTKKGDLYSNETTFPVESTKEELGVDQSSPLEPNVEQGEEFEEKKEIETTPIENDRPFNIDYDKTPYEGGNDSTGFDFEE